MSFSNRWDQIHCKKDKMYTTLFSVFTIQGVLVCSLFSLGPKRELGRTKVSNKKKVMCIILCNESINENNEHLKRDLNFM